MIVAVSSVLNEADIIGDVIRHLYAQGVDEILVSDGGSTDGTVEIVQALTDAWFDQVGPFHQADEITRLAHLAMDQGATWILPFDADEFWIDPLGTTVKQVLESQPPNISTIYAGVFKHRDWDHKFTEQNPLSKVCFRPHPDMSVAWGNHHVYGVPGEEIHGLLEVRELQYRSIEHLRAKVEKARQLFDSWAVPLEFGHHMRQLVDSTDLEAEYARLTSGAVVIDPIGAR